MCIIKSFVSDIFERIAAEASRLSHYNKRSTIISREIQTAVQFLLPREFARQLHVQNKYILTLTLTSFLSSILLSNQIRRTFWTTWIFSRPRAGRSLDLPTADDSAVAIISNVQPVEFQWLKRNINRRIRKIGLFYSVWILLLFFVGQHLFLSLLSMSLWKKRDHYMRSVVKNVERKKNGDVLWWLTIKETIREKASDFFPSLSSLVVDQESKIEIVHISKYMITRRRW